MEIQFEDLIKLLDKYLNEKNWMMAERVARLIAAECNKKL